VAFATETSAQTKPFGDQTRVSHQKSTEPIGFGNGSLVVAPIPFESPSLGSGLALGGAYLFKNDVLSDASSLGLGAFKTSNGSEGFGAGLNLSWDEGKWKLRFAAADADLNYDLYAGGVPFGVNQDIAGGVAELTYTPVNDYAYGLSVGYGEYTLKPRGAGSLADDFLRDRDLEIVRISGFAAYDTRDDTFYPRDGAYASATLTNGIFVDGNRSDYLKGVVSAAGYWSVFSESVFAARAVACQANSAAPFFDSCSLGTTDNFRGFVSTEFLDEALFSVQAEYRTGRIGRLGLVAFAGAGAVDSEIAGAIGGDYKAAAGLGLRIRLSKSFPLGYAIDVSVNERGEDLLYISVGQRF
jgi:outer membrane protein assembly factor BamA